VAARVVRVACQTHQLGPVLAEQLDPLAPAGEDELHPDDDPVRVKTPARYDDGRPPADIDYATGGV
jgi:hypothetical protein